MFRPALLISVAVAGCGIITLAGCDNVFRLVPVPDPVVDATGDGDGPPPASDAPLDAHAGCPSGFRSPGDFDGDGQANTADLCPQLPGAQADADGDGLGDNCDPHPSTFGDCIIIFDDFTNLDCWNAYQSWSACGGGVCSPSDAATLDLAAPRSIDSAELRGSLVQIAGGGPTISLFLNDTQAGAPITGNGCELVNNSTDIMATSIVTFANNAQVGADPVNNSPAQVTNDNSVHLVLTWKVQTQVTPNYECLGVTSSSSVPISSGLRYPLVAPNGSQTVIRTKQVVFHPTAFIGYAFGAQCGGDGT